MKDSTQTQSNSCRETELVSLGALYEQDFIAWADNTACLLSERRFSELDIDNLIEEVEDLARRDRQKVKTKLFQLLFHLLKWQYQPEFREYPGTDNDLRQNSWARSIIFQRNDINELLSSSGTLRKSFPDYIEDCYRKARKGAAQETKLPISTFPEVCPYTEAQILDENFFPD